MASAQITRTDTGTTLTMVSGDWHSEYQRDPDGLMYRIIRTPNGALISRLQIDRDTWNAALEAAQAYAAAENQITRTLKSQSNAGRKKTFS